jgi:hypothetical protein
MAVPNRNLNGAQSLYPIMQFEYLMEEIAMTEAIREVIQTELSVTDLNAVRPRWNAQALANAKTNPLPGPHAHKKRVNNTGPWVDTLPRHQAREWVLATIPSYLQRQLESRQAELANYVLRFQLMQANVAQYHQVQANGNNPIPVEFMDAGDDQEQYVLEQDTGEGPNS